MGTIILWAAFCAAVIVLVNLLLGVVARNFPRWGVPHSYGPLHLWIVSLLSIAISVAGYAISNWQTSAIVGETNTFRVVEYFLSTSSFRNAAFGIAISVLSWWWVAGPTRLGRRRSAGEAEAASGLPNLSLLLLILTTFLAVVTAELPAVLGAYRITFGSGGITLETANYNRYAGGTRGGSMSYQNYESGSSEPTDFPTLDMIRWVVGGPQIDSSLFDRDANYVCELSSGMKESYRIAGACNAAKKIIEYKIYASKTTTPIFACMAELDTMFHDQTPVQPIRNFAISYNRAIIAEISDMNWRVQHMRSAMLEFGRLLEQYHPFVKGECKKAGKILTEPKIDVQAIANLLELHSYLPYGHISYAILANFLGDAIGGILILQRWLDRGTSLTSTSIAENRKAPEIWSRYVARTTQNILIEGLGNDTIRERIHGYDYGAKEIIKIYRRDFFNAISDKVYCKGSINEDLGSGPIKGVALRWDM